MYINHFNVAVWCSYVFVLAFHVPPRFNSFQLVQWSFIFTFSIYCHLLSLPLSLFVCFLRNLRNCKSIFIYFVFFSNLFQRPLTVSLVHNEITPPPAAITTTKVSFKENVK